MRHHRNRLHALLAPATTAALVLAAGCASGPSGQPDSGDHTSGSVGQVAEAEGPGGHQIRRIPADGAPRVRLEANPDPHGGWNLRLATERFRFAPEDVNKKVRPNEGHAHLYIDGEKHGRIYGPWFYLPGDALPEGKHTLKVTLSANDHTTWATGEEAIAATTRVTSTGETTGHGNHSDQDGHAHGGHHGNHGHTHSDPQTSDQARDAKPADVKLKAAVSDGQVSPPPRRMTVERGQTVRLVVTSDHPDHVHLHGYDLDRQVGPSQPAVITFTADEVGVFELETHDPPLQLLQLQVQ